MLSFSLFKGLLSALKMKSAGENIDWLSLKASFYEERQKINMRMMNDE
jgi:hypothetical protein